MTQQDATQLVMDFIEKYRAQEKVYKDICALSALSVWAEDVIWQIDRVIKDLQGAKSWNREMMCGSAISDLKAIINSIKR